MSPLAVLAFFTELAALVILGVWGWRTGSGTLTRTLLMLAAPLLFAAFWGVFLAPRANVNLPFWLKMTLKFLAFALVTVVVAHNWNGWVALIFGVAAALSLLADVLQPNTN